MGFHPLAEIFPLITGREFEELKKDIAQNGVREAIVIYDSQILDGRNRFRACQEVGVTPDFVEYDGDDPLQYVISLNLHRRHLSEGQRSDVAASIANLPVGRPSVSLAGWECHSCDWGCPEEWDYCHNCKEDRPESIPSIEGVSQSDAAELMNVSVASVERAAKVQREGVPELRGKVKEGKVSVSAAADVATLDPEEQAEIVAKGEKEILEAAKNIRQEKAKKRKEENDRIKAEARQIPLPNGKYRTIVIDPPWDMKKIQRDVAPDQVDFDYPTMSLAEIADFECGEMAHDDCWVFCWTTQKYLPATFGILEAWGFKYLATMTWHKTGGFQPFGLPQYNSEFVLIGKRGDIEFDDTKRFFLCNEWPRREHSRKPDEFYDLIARVSPEPRIDVFSREKREGFVQFGAEADKFQAGA